MPPPARNVPLDEESEEPLLTFRPSRKSRSVRFSVPLAGDDSFALLLRPWRLLLAAVRVPPPNVLAMIPVMPQLASLLRELAKSCGSEDRRNIRSSGLAASCACCAMRSCVGRLFGGRGRKHNVPR